MSCRSRRSTGCPCSPTTSIPRSARSPVPIRTWSTAAVEHPGQQARGDEYFYQDLDEKGARLNGANRYTVTFADGQLPPVKGFWSLTMYNRHHFFEPNAIQKYSVGTKNKDLKKAADGSLTIYVQSAAPADPLERANWLPSPANADFSLYVRAYWPEDAIKGGQWTPPAVVKVP